MTDIGLVRKDNQDAYGIEERTDCGHTVCVVCDGMGGAAGGRLASTIAVNTYLQELKRVLTPEMTPEQLREASSYAVSLANRAIREEAARSEECRNMGTTLVAAVSCGADAVVVSNVGDSRAYRVTQDGITRITKDHSLVESMVDRGDITAEEARHHPNRNLITRALGPDENTLCDAFEVSFTKGDKILLCTDGLVVTATDDEICRAVCAGKSAEESLDDLIALAKAQGAPDNVTAVLIEHE